MESIPQIIHQTWKNSDIPEHLIPLIQTWKDNHPDWEYILWTDDMNRDFIKQRHPDYLSDYDNFPHNIQRVDAVRYFILYELGGLFIDMDFECLTNIESLLKNNYCVFGTEPEEHCKRLNKEKIICNAFMACSVHNDFLKKICSDLKHKKYTNYSKPAWLQILESTGPFKLTEIYDQYADKKGVKLLTANLIYPLSLAETREVITNDENISGEIQNKLNQAYAVHYFLGSWY